MIERIRTQVTIYTDGACDPNPGGPGGYGIVIVSNGKSKELSGGFRSTTNNRMEVYAAIVGLSSLVMPSNVRLFSDSAYLVRSMTLGWVKRWKARDWWRTKREKALNIDLWEQLLPLCELHQVEFIWVRGHAGNPYNERCDKLAVTALRRKNLAVDQGYEQSCAIKKPAKVTRVGQACQKCATPVVKRVPRRKLSSNQISYYEYYLYCPQCHTRYFVDEAKRLYQPKKLF